MSGNWIFAAQRAVVPDDDVVAIQVEARELAFYGVDGTVYATDNICTHGHARLCDGFLEGHEIECPLHQGKFDVRTGNALCAPLIEGIKSYPIKVEDGKVFVLID